MSDLFNQPGADVLVIGVGALGCALAGRGALNDACELPRQAEWAALHTQSSELFATGLEHRALVAMPAGPISDASVALALGAREDDWKRWCAGKRIVLVAASEDDAFASLAAQILVSALKDSGTDVLWISAASENNIAPVIEHVPVIRAMFSAANANAGVRTMEAQRSGWLLEIVEACLAALHIGISTSPWMNESFADFLRWGRMDLNVGHAPSMEALRTTLGDLAQQNSEASFLLLHGGQECSISELNQLRSSSNSTDSDDRLMSVLSVDGRSVEEGLFWMLLSRRAHTGNVVRLDRARQNPRTITSAAFARI